MLRRGTFRALPRRDTWHALQEYAVGEVNHEEFRHLRARDARVSAAAAAVEHEAINWAHWNKSIANRELVRCIESFHTQQMALLDSMLQEDRSAVVKKSQHGCWDLFSAAVESCQQSVQKSEETLRNGARALWISFQNPPIGLLSQTEWLDVDQYWQAFVEKHHFYHNHLNSAFEDPESKEFDSKNENELIKKWDFFDGSWRKKKKLIYQKPSYEHYDLFRGPLVEHMMFFLVKTGGDARMFREKMPVQWLAEIYDIRFRLYSVLQRRLHFEQETSLTRKIQHDFHPQDLESEGEGHFAKLIAHEAAVTELAVGRLMGNYILFSDSYVPVQTGMAFYSALQMDDGKGTFYSLGPDVHCLFYKPSDERNPMPDPKDCVHSLANHVSMTGRRFNPGYGEALETFADVLASRKQGLRGHWFAAPGESSKEAFLRRLKKNDSAKEIYRAYAVEHSERWKIAEELRVEDAEVMIREIERKYIIACEEYGKIVAGFYEELTVESTSDMDRISKLRSAEELQTNLEARTLVAMDGVDLVSRAGDLVRNLEEFRDDRDKFVEATLAVKIPGLDKK